MTLPFSILPHIAILDFFLCSLLPFRLEQSAPYFGLPCLKAVAKLAVEKFAVIKFAVDKLAVDKFAAGQKAVEKLAVEILAVDKLALKYWCILAVLDFFRVSHF